jgi:dTDP-glucose 4,6-dehydratase
MGNAKRILITGATSYIGEAILRRWSTLGLGRIGEVRLRTIVSDLNSDKVRHLQEMGVEVVCGELTDNPSFPDLMKGVDVVVQAAAQTALSKPKQTWNTEVETTHDLFVSAIDTRVERFLYISSMNVYGGTDVLAGEEEAPVPFGDPYSDSKQAAERSLINLCQPDRPQLTILRLANVYGPNAPKWTKDPVERALRKQLAVPGSGEFSFPYLFVDNMVDAVTAAVFGAPGIYDIFDGVTTYRDFMSRYASMAGTRLQNVPIQVLVGLTALSEWVGLAAGQYPQLNRRALQALQRCPPSDHDPRPEKAMRELNWQPRVNLDEGMFRIEHSNGFHKNSSKNDDPWKQNNDWGKNDL